MPIMFPTAKRSLDALFSCRRSLALVLLIVRGVWGLNCPPSYLLGVFSFRLLLSLLDLLFTSLLLTIGYLPINGCTVLVDICIAGLLSILDFENHKEGLSFSIIVIPRADCIHLIVMRCINKVIIRLAVPCLSNYYNFVSSKFTRKNTIYYLQVACVICPKIRREIFSIVKLYIQFC